MKKLLFVFLFLLILPLRAFGVTYYVHPTSGSDSSNTCPTATSPVASNAKQTIAGGIGCLASGDTLRLHSATYTDLGISTLTTQIPSGGGSYTLATIIEAYNGPVTWRPGAGGADAFVALHNSNSYIIFRGTASATFTFDGVNMDSNQAFGFWLKGANTHHVKWEHVEIKNTKLSAIYSDKDTHDNWLFDSYVHDIGYDTTAANDALDHGFYAEGDGMLIDGNWIEHIAGTCTQFFSNFANDTSNNGIFRKNYCKDADAGGVVVDGVNDSIIGNEIVSVGTTSVYAGGITCGYAPGSSGMKAYKNTIHGNDGYGIVLGQPQTGTTGCLSVDIQDNSMSSNSQQCLLKASGTVSGTADQNNCSGNGNNAFTAAGLTSTNVSTDAPTYTNTSIFDFTLQSTSLLVGAGTVTAPTGVTCNGTCDIGAHETFSFASATLVDDASDNKVLVNFLNNAGPPILPISTCTGFTLLKNGGPDAQASCDKSGDAQITIVTTGSHIGGDGETINYSPGNVTSTGVGGSYTNHNQKLFAFGSAQTVANPISGSIPILTQEKCQFFSFGGTVNAADSPLANANTDIFLIPGACARLRCDLKNTVANFGSGGFLPYYSKSAAAYAVLPNGPPVATSISFPSVGNLPPEYGTTSTATTEALGGTGTFTPGGSQPSSSETPNLPLTNGQSTELDFPFCLGTSNTNLTTYDFRYKKAGGVDLNTYTVIPRVTVSTTGSKATTGER